MLSINLFKIDFTRFEYFPMDLGAWLTDINSKIHLEVGSLVFEAIDAIGIVCILGYSRL